MSDEAVNRNAPQGHWLHGIPAPLRLLAGAALGAVGAFGQAPYDQPAALVLALAGAFALWRAEPTMRATALLGWAVGTGYFAHALIWILEPFQVDAARHGWMAPFAVFFLSSGLALFWAAAFWLARQISLSAGALVITWTLAELARAYLFTGFPWASPAQAVIDGPASRLLALVGPHGTTFCVMVLAWVVSLSAGVAARQWPLRLGQGAIFTGAMLAMYLPLAVPPAAVTEHVVRLIQPNAEQHLKWQPEYAELFFQRQLTFTAAPAVSPGVTPDMIVWPETSIPWRLGTAEPALRDISNAAKSVPVVLGVLRFEGDTLRNALAVLGPDGRPQSVYDKHHLVPFGEYIPFAHLAERVGLRGLVAQSVGFSAGPGPKLIDFGPLGKALPLICYEAVFAHGVNAGPERPAFLLQVTNDAWFGTYAGPQQHLAQARMRAIEQGLPMARAANTGVSAMIDPYGRITAEILLGRAGFVDATLPASVAPTVYSRTGDAPIFILLILMLVVAFTRHQSRIASESN